MSDQKFQWKEMKMGVCYYPEHWSQELWENDLRRMRKAGISCVRIAEFSWALLEPREGDYRIGYFDSFLSLCEKESMQVIFGTPTATPPAWLTEKYPEVLNADKNGVLFRHGCRRHYNYNSSVYQEKCAQIVRRIAEHYGKHPMIVGWQIDNELNCETDLFYSDADNAAFRVFLEKKYHTLDALNEAWGTVVWSQSYSDWSEIHVPRPAVNNGHNPHQMLDYYRFISESAIRFAALQADILRQYIKEGDFITTNGIFGNLDNHRLQEDVLDVYTYDSYPSFAFGLDRKPREANDLNDRKWSKNLTEVRSVCPHFGIMEQQSGACGWANRMEGPAPRPGQLTLWAMQSVAHGADYISFFRWRTATIGTEIYWHGILDYDNRDNRKLSEVTEFGKMLKSLDPVCGAAFKAAFALLRDYDNDWDAQADVWHERVKSQSEKEIFVSSALTHTPYDVIDLKDDTALSTLLKYPVVIYPHPVIMTEKRAELLASYVREGGILVIGCRSAYKDLSGHCVMLPQPGFLREIMGTDVSDFTFTSPNEDPVFADWNGKKTEMPLFNDILNPLPGTKVLARYENSYYAGEAAMTEHPYGKGKAIHYGAAFNRENAEELFRYTGIMDPFRSYISVPSDVELVLREKDGKKYIFVLNYMPEDRRITLHVPAVLMYTKEEVMGEITLPPFGTAVYQME